MSLLNMGIFNNPDAYKQDPIEGYLKLIAEWDERTLVKPDVLPGCQLRRDVDEHPSMPTPLHAWAALVSSVDALCVLSKLYQHESGQVHELATPAIARLPILGACTAIWLLQPERSKKRLDRGLRFGLKNIENLSNFTEPLRKQEDPATRELDAMLAEERELVAVTRKRLSLSDKEKPSDTSLISEVTSALEKLGVCSHQQVTGLWRYCSGAVHARAWAARLPRPDDPYDFLDDLIGVGVSLTLYGFNLWDRRTEV